MKTNGASVAAAADRIEERLGYILTEDDWAAIEKELEAIRKWGADEMSEVEIPPYYQLHPQHRMLLKIGLEEGYLEDFRVERDALGSEYYTVQATFTVPERLLHDE